MVTSGDFNKECLYRTDTQSLFTRKLRNFYFRQVFWLIPFQPPSRSQMDSGYRLNHIMGLTATGIVPDLHRIPY